MQCAGSPVLAGMGCLLFGIAGACAESGGERTYPDLAPELILEKNVCVHNEAVQCFLRWTNTGDKVSLVRRPKPEYVLFEARGTDQASHSVLFEGTKAAVAGSEVAWLQPRCELETSLGAIVLKDADGENAPIPPGEYILTASWQDHELGRQRSPGAAMSASCSLEVVNGRPGAQAGVSSATLASGKPIVVTLKSARDADDQGKPIELNVRIANAGDVAVRLMNYFHPYKDHFELALQRQHPVSGEFLGVVSQPYPVKLITPHATTGWLTLLPRESVSVKIDVSGEFEGPGLYRAAVEYRRPVLLLPRQGEPRYAEQRSWKSNTITITIQADPDTP